MCGIAGMWRSEGLSGDAPRLAARMTRLLAHRGPDDEQVIPIGGRTPWAVLGARRLAILDPEHGRQPTHDASKRFWVALNGEIYNHRRLRQELVANGVPVRTHSDTEVIAHLVATVGVETALSRLRGMFALAIVDTEDRRLWLVRDRMGQKPLYWAQGSDGTLYWSSELGALRAAPGVGGAPDRRALQALLLWEHIPAPWTPWAGIQKLTPGAVLEASADGVARRRYWLPPVPQAGRAGSGPRWARSIRGALEVAVAQRLDEADVEVGVLLSGGLDSTTVAALCQGRRDAPIRTFSMAVRAPGFDESSWGARAAKALGTHHEELHLDADELPGLLDDISRHMSEPLADSSLVATWKLMRGVRAAGLKCVLSGDGADESFGGYPTLQAHRLASLANPGRRWLQPLARQLPTRHDGVTRDYMVRRFTEGLGWPWARRHQIWMGAWLPRELTWRAGEADAIWDPVDQHATACATTDLPSRALYLDQRLYLAEGVLTKVDRASMAHGVEVRSPFLDHMLVELAAQVPLAFKASRGQGKRILREAVSDLVPDEILRRPKKGFGTPVGPWLRANPALLHGVEEALEDLIAPSTFRRVLDEHERGVQDHRRRLWSALVLARWRGCHA